MTKGKHAPTASGALLDASAASPSLSPALAAQPNIGKPADPSSAHTASIRDAQSSKPSTSTLIICRNKHWRYISSFQGPWLQLPPEVLESLAYSNYASPRPRPVDPAVFFDLVKVRRLVDEATNLAVRAANGTTSSSLSTSMNAGGGILGGGGAAALGLGLGGAAPRAKLSRERRHRMREAATQKLSQAYQLDEIATSVATMQSASSLEEVAKLVLQRSVDDSDAKYVHFFHEKIPSRMLAQCTSLKPLDEVIQERPADGAPLRTRALTRIFKDDFAGAAKDLTDGLAVCRYMMTQHKAGSGPMALGNALGGAERIDGNSRDWRYEKKLGEEDQPNSLEPQLLFHRAGVYLAIACQNIHSALDPGATTIQASVQCVSVGKPLPAEDANENEAQRCRLEARKAVKANAKRALRDYLSFLSSIDYTPGLSTEVTEEFFRRVNAAANGFFTRPRVISPSRQLEMSGNSSSSDGHLNDVLNSKHDNGQNRDSSGFHDSTMYPSLPPSEVHPVSSLFSSARQVDLAPYPATSLALVTTKESSLALHPNALANKLLATSEQHEAITYHPLLTDALHSLLLCHALIQTSPKEHLRHAHMVARLSRVCDGYPIFLAARSPSRADWIEVIRRADNWIGLQQSWESLCSPAPLPGHPGPKEESEAQAKERRKQEAIVEALADDRVHDEASFQAAVAAREKRAEEQRKEALGQGGSGPKRWAQEDGKEYSISTERADAIARWVREAPLSVEGTGKTRKSGKKGREANIPEISTTSLSQELEEASVNGKRA
ncbi:MAG: fungal specific transcription factor domain-containing [Lasallia pustulata]|uniref:Fungal specific transcription factor domain-containing n=1 Tax=Lasallia pustulata TaxID=136370 RepID=A0A5M8PNE2_9LECA|nr:MAG: fungal specific transcription factor domain-containing [Lasallia pustulata]